MTESAIQIVHCDIAVIGGSLGGCAVIASLPDKPNTAGIREPGTFDALMTEACDWIGGQITAQGVSALDEHRYIETFGGTAAYLDLRDAIRQHYQWVYGAPPIMKESVLGSGVPLNPGNGWVSRLCFLPADAVPILKQMLEQRNMRLL